jgi:excisionase family DNA binding protein
VNLDEIGGRATITIEEAAELLGISRGSAYEAARSGELPTLPLGRRRLVPVPRLLSMLGASDDTTEGDDPPRATGLRVVDA